jgi:hypothetical protein
MRIDLGLAYLRKRPGGFFPTATSRSGMICSLARVGRQRRRLSYPLNKAHHVIREWFTFWRLLSRARTSDTASGCDGVITDLNDFAIQGTRTWSRTCRCWRFLIEMEGIVIPDNNSVGVALVGSDVSHLSESRNVDEIETSNGFAESASAFMGNCEI